MYVIILPLLAYPATTYYCLYPILMYFDVVLCIWVLEAGCDLRSGRVASKQLP